MEKTTKFNYLITDIKAGDTIIFTDGNKKTIKKISNGHRIIFDDGSNLDLWVAEGKILEVISKEIKKEEPIASPFDFKSMPPVKPVQKSVNVIPLATNYKELNKKLYHGGDNIEFFHITAAQNAYSILMGDYLYSREAGLGHVRYDNIKLNDTTGSVMGSNRSYRLEKYARFYLNIRNGATCSFCNNYSNHSTFGVIIAVGFSSIWKAKTKVLLSPINAHYLEDDDFNWSKYNIADERNLKNLDANRFNFRSTFLDYDKNIDNPYMMAEILFYEKISLDNISHIYFKRKIEMDYFLSKLPYNKRKMLESKCVVKKELFW